MISSAKQTHPTDEIHLVFDIDETIAYREKSLPTFMRSLNVIEVDYFVTKFYCALHPGVIELLQWLDNLSNTHISFFSGGNVQLNAPFVKKMFSIAFPNTKPNKQYDVYSHGSMKYEQQTHVKDLRVTLTKPTDTLERTLLIDDLYNTAKGQEKNLFRISSAKVTTFSCCSVDDIFAANHIFYMVALIADAINLGRNIFLENIALLHAIASQGNPVEQWLYYQSGLKELQKINPDLRFHTNGNDIEKIIKSAVKDKADNHNEAKLHQSPSSLTLFKANNNTMDLANMTPTNHNPLLEFVTTNDPDNGKEIIMRIHH